MKRITLSVLYAAITAFSVSSTAFSQEMAFKPLPLPLGEIVTYTSEQFFVPPDCLASGGDGTRPVRTIQDQTE